MTLLYNQGRAILLALLVAISTVTAAYSHPLPGTLVIFSREGSQLQVTIQFALEDLAIAFPEIASLEDAPNPGALPPAYFVLLRTYFDDHIALQSNSVDVPISLSHARLRLAENDHVGAFTQVVADFTVVLPLSGDVPPLALFYDAVMHEVRSHSATVYWRNATDDLRAVAEFHYSAEGQPIQLDFQ